MDAVPQFTEKVRAELEARRSLLARRPFPVIDGDAHVTDIRALRGSVSAAYRATSNYYHGRPISAEELVAEMDMAEVDRMPPVVLQCGEFVAPLTDVSLTAAPIA